VAALRDCDIVMKGGVTSAVVYVGAVVELARSYRFRSIGGTSSGAIAAAFTAAAEYRRQRDGLEGLAEPLAGVADQLTTPGFQERIFQAAPPMRPLMRVFLAAVKQGRPRTLTGIAIVAALVRGRWLAAIGPAAIGIGLWTLFATQGWLSLVLALALAVPVLLITVCVGVVASAGALALSVKRFLNDPRHGFGICSGMPEGSRHLAVTDWMHQAIQDAAGLPPSRPLTFRDLDEMGIAVEMLCTDVSCGMPVRLPLARNHGYHFRVDDLRHLFPDAVLEHVRCHAGKADARGLRSVPAEDLPIVVAARLSLSFPVLISAVRLYDASGREHWISDGGIGSNFPIHFFDRWQPTRPTFGLDLRSFMGEPMGDLVWLPKPDDDPFLFRWSPLPSVAIFVRQVVDAAQNWRDSAQADLLGYRDRMCQIRLTSAEGAFNLNMSEETIKELIARGKRAGSRIADQFDLDGHLATRYELLMYLLQGNLQDFESKYSTVRPRLLARQPPGADAETQALLKVARRWGSSPDTVDFTDNVDLDPTPAMRITPRT
jgi:predicted acylesterase/phospholipase RssA